MSEHTHLDETGAFVGKHNLGPHKIGLSFKEWPARWALRFYCLLAWRRDPALVRDIIRALRNRAWERSGEWLDY